MVEVAEVVDLAAVASAEAVVVLVVAGHPEAGKGPFPDRKLLLYHLLSFRMDTN
jgi:hypothetical protein